MVKKAVLLLTAIIGAAILAAGVGMFGAERRKFVKEYRESQAVFGNPLMGYAKNAWHEEVAEDVSLLYVDITWAELEPEEGIYAWTAIEEENQIARWKKEGKHLVLRFLCDLPGTEAHMDIPQWLYEKSGEAGQWYNGEYGKGFAPDYRDPTIIDSHAKAVKALGEHLGQDGMISYIELGSLGHWGEWHVNYEEGIARLPGEKIREAYIRPWMEAFPDAMLLMRRPFAAAKTYGFGLYNDMTGYEKDTKTWFGWIERGGEYEQTGEKNALAAMKDFWKTAPSGGEFTSSLAMEEMLVTDLERTVELIREAHTTFLGPKVPPLEYPEGYQEVLKNMGYRIWISSAEIKKKGKGSLVRLVWKNSGVAPFYKDWPAYLYLEDSTGKIIEKQEIKIKISSLLPDMEIVTDTWLELKAPGKLKINEYRLSVGMEDPMTKTAQVRFAMEAFYQDGKNYLW